MSYTVAEVQRYSALGDVTPNGVAFDWGHLPDVNGGDWFVLLCEPGKHSIKDMEEAASFLEKTKNVGQLRIEVVRAVQS
jgi:hypothetical protein